MTCLQKFTKLIFTKFTPTSAVNKLHVKIRGNKFHELQIFPRNSRNLLSSKKKRHTVYTCNGSPWFPSIFPAKNLLVVWHAAAFRIRPFAMAAEEKVASALNRLADRAFLDVLSPRDKSSMVNLMADFSRRIHKRTRGQRGRRGAW